MFAKGSSSPFLGMGFKTLHIPLTEMGSPGADQLICLPRMDYAGLGFVDRDLAVLVQADHTGPAASPLTSHLCTEFPCAQPVAYVITEGSRKALLGECFHSW